MVAKLECVWVIRHGVEMVDAIEVGVNYSIEYTVACIILYCSEIQPLS